MSRWRSIIIVPAVVCLAAAGLTLTGGPTAPARAAGGCFPAGGQSIAPAAAPATSGIVVQGGGYGHALGMSQYGAQGAALLGCNHAQILSSYYAGTHLQRRALTAPVVLALKSGAARTTVLAENGKVTWVAPTGTRVVQPRGQTWTAVPQTRNRKAGTCLLDGSGRLKLFVTSGTLKAAHAGVTVRVRTYGSAAAASTDKRLRWGTVGVTRSGSGVTVEETIATDSRGRSVDKYLWALGEVPVTWPGEALRAQADAARTYLTGAYSAGAYRIGTTTAAQVYAGASREDEDARYRSPWKAAVNATSGEVVVNGQGATITAMYSSSDGGRSESRAYVYGSQGGYDYLASIDDSRWDLASTNPYRAWAKAFTPQEFAAALGFSSVSAVSLAAPGTAGRADGLKVTGVIGGQARTIAFSGGSARSALGLRSSAFTVSWLQPVPTTPTALTVQPLVGDWDGDGKDDLGVFKAGQVSLRMADGSVARYLLGATGDIAVVGDWDGDGKDSVGVYRAGTWSLRNALSAGPFDTTFSFGFAGALPVTGDWAGSGHQGIGVVSGGHWYLRTTVTAGAAERTFAYGLSGDRPLAGDWDGDGADTPGVFRNGGFWLESGLGSGTSRGVRIGRATDVPVVGNWDGAGADGTGVYREPTFFYRDDLLGGVGTTTVTFAG